MNAFRVEEDMPMESSMLSLSLERTQKKIETYYYDIRKQVFEYEEVIKTSAKLYTLKGALRPRLSTIGSTPSKASWRPMATRTYRLRIRISSDWGTKLGC